MVVEHGSGSPDICLVTDSEEPSGLGEHMLALLELVGRRRRVALACSNAPKARAFVERARAAGIDRITFDWREADTARRFAAWLSDRKIDLCHVHAGICWEAQGLAAVAKRAGVAVVIRTEHLPFVAGDPAERVRYARAMLSVDRIICVSREARDSFTSIGMPAERIAIIRNGVHPPPCRPDCMAVRSELGLPDTAKMVLTVARFTEQKDHRTLLDAIPTVLAREPRARFVWVGTGPLEQQLLDAVRQRDLSGHVMFVGQRRDVPDLMAASNAFALPSRFEGLPLAVLEAMAIGLPVVATRVCGTAEAVRHGITGLLVKPAQPDALAAALIEVLTRPEWARQLGERGRARALRRFSAERMARETMALYDEVWRRNQATPSAFQTTGRASA
jgi:glycosyltransferase involved in cell wall biosynthesis